MYQGGYGTRVGIQGGYREGLYRVLPTQRARKVQTSEAGPEALQGPEWWVWGWTRDRRLDGLLRPPSGPGRAPVPSLSQDPSECRLLANKGEIRVHIPES